MRFPGQRIAKHYFPVSGTAEAAAPDELAAQRRWYLLGLDQVLVDLEVHAPEALVAELGIARGESIQLSDARYGEVLRALEAESIPFRYAAGGSVGNTLNNYAMLSGEPAVLLGALPSCIRPGDAAFHYVAQTHRAVDLAHLEAVDGVVGTAITFIYPDGERSFAVAAGVSNDFGAEDLPPEVVQQSSAVLTTLYTLIDGNWPIARATHALLDTAKAADLPVALGLGTAALVRRMRAQVQALLAEHVWIAAMNAREAEALTELDDPLLACERVLDWVDVAVVTQGEDGLTLGGWADEALLRPTRQELRSGAIENYNRHEYSRLMRRSDCARPVKIYTQIFPYQGGPERIGNANGAGDAALAAILHDLTANRYHRQTVPDSAKHRADFLSYSSLSRIAQYGNRVAYEVLCGSSPRLDAPVGRDEPRDASGPAEAAATDAPRSSAVAQLPLFGRAKSASQPG